MTLLMGLYARLPFAAAPGMGMNAFIAYTIILGEKVPWQIALGITFWAGVLFALVSVTSFRVSIANAIPFFMPARDFLVQGSRQLNCRKLLMAFSFQGVCDQNPNQS